MKCSSIEVRGYHCDAYGHVNNARYLEFLEEGRWSWLEKGLRSGWIDTQKLQFVLVNLNISYRKPLVPGDIAEIHVDSVEYKNMSVILNQRIIRGLDAQVCADAQVTFVMLSIERKRPVPIDKELQTAFENLMNQ